jgi:hypothetical protein
MPFQTIYRDSRFSKFSQMVCLHFRATAIYDEKSPPRNNNTLQSGPFFPVNFDILIIKRCFLTIRILSNLPPKSRKWHFRDSKFKNFLGPSALAFSPPNRKKLPTALVIKPKIQSKFPDSLSINLEIFLQRTCLD